MRTPKKILERRQSVRVAEKLPFTLGHQGYDTRALAINISRHGALCVVDKDIPMMTQLQVAFTLPSFWTRRLAARRKIRARGVVVRKQKSDPGEKVLLGIFFTEMKSTDQKALDEFIKDRLKIV